MLRIIRKKYTTELIRLIKFTLQVKSKVTQAMHVHTPSVLLAIVPLKERDVDFLDSSSAGISKGPETANCPAGDATCNWKSEAN